MRNFHNLLFRKTLIPNFKTSIPNSSLSTSNSNQKFNPTSVIITNPLLISLENCNSMRELKIIQARMHRSGMINHKFPISRVLAFCALSQFGDLIHSLRIFAQISNPNAFINNSMIRSLHWFVSPSESIDFFKNILEFDSEIDDRTFVFVLKSSESFSNFTVGISIHSLIVKLGFDLGLLVINSLMHFYVKFSLISSAESLFFWGIDLDVVSWTVIVDGNVQLGFFKEGLEFFRRMIFDSGVVPNEITLISVLSACSKTKILNLGKSVHGFAIRKGINMSINFLNSLIDMYGKSGCLDYSGAVFDFMGKNKNRDVFSYTTMINAFAKSGDFERARWLFDETPVKNAVTWSAMIACYAQSGQPIAALDLFSKMQSLGIDPIEATLISVLSACAQSGRLDIGRRTRGLVESKKVELTTTLANAFIDMYAKCGAVTEAADVFSSVSEKDLVTWNSMILGYAVHGRSEDALAVFERMKAVGERPDDITFLGVLSACAHAGLVQEGRRQFSDMEAVFSVTPSPEHYSCFVGMLARAGLLEEAAGVIMMMPGASEKAAWGALLHGCRVKGEVELGKVAGRALLDLDKSDSGAYVLLSGLCAGGGEWEGAKTARRMMKEGGVRKAPGRSSIEVDGEVHEFFAAGKSHALSGEIYRVLDLVYVDLGLEARCLAPSPDPRLGLGYCTITRS